MSNNLLAQFTSPNIIHFLSFLAMFLTKFSNLFKNSSLEFVGCEIVEQHRSFVLQQVQQTKCVLSTSVFFRRYLKSENAKG